MYIIPELQVCTDIIIVLFHLYAYVTIRMCMCVCMYLYMYTYILYCIVFIYKITTLYYVTNSTIY